MPPPRLHLLILAAGKGSRVGINKALLPLNGRPGLEILAEQIRASRFEDALVVSGAQAGEVESLAMRLHLSCVRNPDFEEGQSTSVVAGVARLPEDIDGFAILPVDHLLTTTSDLDALVRAFQSHPAARERIFRPHHGEERGHPVLFGQSFRREFLELEGAPAHGVYRAHPSCWVPVPVQNPHIARDVDTTMDRAWAESVLKLRAASQLPD